MRRQDTANWESVAHVRIGHQRTGHGNRQLAGILQLLHGIRFEVAAPDLVRSITC
jgi:hypothetical protein